MWRLLGSACMRLESCHKNSIKREAAVIAHPGQILEPQSLLKLRLLGGRPLVQDRNVSHMHRTGAGVLNRKCEVFFDDPRCAGGCCRWCPVAAAGDHGADSMQGRYVSLGWMHARLIAMI